MYSLTNKGFDHYSSQLQTENTLFSCFTFNDLEPVGVTMSSWMDLHLAGTSIERSSLNENPMVKKMVKKIFMKTNTALRSSTPVEC